ncbi:hypothetical protein Hypma_012048 [Hypsizygus marmoreus]|uniref:Uncharacterized protein n=1 Tax=Hypsizygus marmoreus TaxID=39966 RepID=A0A369JQ74_HYPMA|nr:hypothetical protein Hypma_012048 [Hypsizygus marmoreus]
MIYIKTGLEHRASSLRKQLVSFPSSPRLSMHPAVFLSIFTLAAGPALALPLEDPNPQSFAVRSNGLRSSAADDLASRALRALTWPLSSKKTKAPDNVCKKTWQSRQTTGEESCEGRGMEV